MADKDVVAEMRRKGFTCTFGHDPDTETFFALFQHQATRLACITMEPGKYFHVPVHPFFYHVAKTLQEALEMAAESAMRPASEE